MRLKEIYIYGYGKFRDLHIKNLADLQIFYGENEAGKSTIMSFVQSMLFGFPPKQQSSQPRYEPKTGSSYGGKIIMASEKFGEVAIERIRGKAAGDVMILLEDGTVKGEEFLREMLNGMDRQMFESVFSFHLEGLQQVHRLKEEDIAKYLIAAGTVGTDLLLQAEQHFQKELQQLFKPGGRKPRINIQIKQLREQEQLLKKARKENIKYETLLKEKENAANGMRALDQILDEKKKRFRKYEELYKAWPLIMETQQLKKRLEQLGPVDFPAQGIARLDKYKDQMIRAGSALTTAKQKVAETMKELEEHSPLPGFEQNRAELLLRGWSQYEQNAEKMSVINRDIDESEKEIAHILKELNWSRDASASIHELNLGMDMKAKLKDQVGQFVRLEGKLSDSEDMLKNELALLKEWEETCREIERDLIDEETFQKWKKQYDMHESFALAEQEKRYLEMEIDSLLRQKSREEKEKEQKRKQAFFINSLFLSLFAFVFIWSFLSGEWIFALFSLAAILYSCVTFTWRKKNDGGLYDESIQKKKEQLKTIEEAISLAAGQTDFTVRFERQLKLREEWKQSYHLLEQQRKKVENAKVHLEKIRSAMAAIQNGLNQIKKSFGLSESFFNGKLEDAFQLLQRLQKLDEHIQSQKEQLSMLSGKQREWFAELKSILGSFDIPVTEPSEAVFILKNLLDKERKKQILFQELKKKLQALQADVLFHENEQKEINAHISQLLKAADVETEEAFRKKAELYAEAEKLKARLNLLESQVDPDQLVPDFQTVGELKGEIAALKESIEKDEQKLDRFRHQLASLAQEIRFLENGGTYTEHLHQFYHMRSILNEDAKKWAELAAAKAILKKTLQKYQEERFPQAMQKAAEFFTMLTDGEYRRLYLQGDGNLVVERKDRTVFTPAEMSKGTGEQLYTAIRLGLIYVLREEFPFPIFIDDGFVNFDKKRTQRVLKLIKQVSSDTQVLLFTCHPHLIEQLPGEKVMQLEKRAVQLSGIQSGRVMV